MQANEPKPVYLEDYAVPPHLIDETNLHIDIHDDVTRVTAMLDVHLNPAVEVRDAAATDLVLNGSKDLVTRSVAVDGRTLNSNEYRIVDDVMTIFGVPDAFTLTTQVEIKPQDNMALEGLYKSGALYCTQCEAEGFRQITWYPDRPDVMSGYTTTLVADQASYPVLLSNGNAVGRGVIASDADASDKKGDRHWVTWEDPFRKPSYLFALVAGDLQHIEDEFTTMSGRKVKLQIFTEAHNINKVDYAMESLKNSMAWDERIYGREYDLDIFMVVAVDSFNMGAMENKGLNIFNTACILASPDTTTDESYQVVESTVAHEYFHNWSGNRVTCREWFQLSLKEGFTVFRDQQFSEDAGSPVICRIKEVTRLRNSQFPEDAGPMAHPIRPDSYIEIDNFYTPTVYSKGAEVVRMIHRLLGKKRFRQGTDLYFERHDGQAVTTEEFVAAMEDASGVDLQQFRVWYRQAGTPLLKVTGAYDEAAQTFTLTVSQSCPPTPGQIDKALYHLPLAVGLLDADGRDIAFPTDGLDVSGVEGADDGAGYTAVLNLTQASQSYVFRNMQSRPTPSLLRGFSAPVTLEYGYTRDELMFLMSHDSDGFNRWEAGQRLAVEVLQEVAGQIECGGDVRVDERLIEAFGMNLRDAVTRHQDETLDKAMVARMLVLPTEAYLVELAELANIDAIHAAMNVVLDEVARQLGDELLSLYQLNQRSAGRDEPYRASGPQIARRALKNIALAYLMHPKDTTLISLGVEQFNHANNMTDTRAALVALVGAAAPAARSAKATALKAYYDRWQDDALVVDSWFAIQASCRLPSTLDQVKALLDHEAFDFKTPNRMRALVTSFAFGNLVNFHQKSGGGYEFLADRAIELDPLNPLMAARILDPLIQWRKYDKERQALMKSQLSRILDVVNLSGNVFEKVSKSL